MYRKCASHLSAAYGAYTLASKFSQIPSFQQPEGLIGPVREERGIIVHYNGVRTHPAARKKQEKGLT